jgi:hypothetical protein|tara:strand:+ start:3524 stop:4018 length:495 start_codon:yes stop_codon:yes gene_type:complete
MGAIMKARVKQLETIGEEEIFDRISNGMTVRSFISEMGMGWRAFYKWVDSHEGRRGRYEEAMHASAHFYANRAVDTAQAADIGSVNVARLQVDTDKWIASKLSPMYDVRQRDVNVNISVQDLHAQAHELLASNADIIDVVAEEVKHEVLESVKDNSDGNEEKAH